MTDPHTILGVPRDATPDQVRAAYRRLARELHPDVSDRQDAADRFAALNEAYERLTDPQRPPASPAPTPHDPGEAAEVYDAFFRRDAAARARPRRPPPAYTRVEGTLDLALDLPLTVSEAAEGVSPAVPTPDGPRRIDIPPGVRDGRVIRLDGAGARGRAGVRGDLLVTVRVVPPSGAAIEPDHQERTPPGG